MPAHRRTGHKKIQRIDRQTLDTVSRAIHFDLQLQQVFDLAREVTFAENRRKGAARFYLPGSGRVAVPVRSKAFRAWMIQRYSEHHGEELRTEVLEAFINRASFSSRHAPVSVPRAR